MEEEENVFQNQEGDPEVNKKFKHFRSCGFQSYVKGALDPEGYCPYEEVDQELMRYPVGPRGARGPRGLQGEPGPRGPKGDPGPKGESAEDFCSVCFKTWKNFINTVKQLEIETVSVCVESQDPFENQEIISITETAVEFSNYIIPFWHLVGIVFECNEIKVEQITKELTRSVEKSFDYESKHCSKYSQWILKNRTTPFSIYTQSSGIFRNFSAEALLGVGHGIVLIEVNTNLYTAISLCKIIAIKK